MGFKKVLEPFQIVTAGVMTGTDEILSPATNIKNLDNVGMQVSWTGTPVGVISVVCSVDNVTYMALTFDPVLAQPSGTADGYLINLNQVPFPWVKLRYVNVSGVGVLNAYICGKDLN